jgi:hypothetical protein
MNYQHGIEILLLLLREKLEALPLLDSVEEHFSVHKALHRDA